MNFPQPDYPTAPAPAISRMGRFYITRELGRGAIATVYLGHDPVIDRAVAIKTFNTRLTPFERKRHDPDLINEARAAGRLSHAGIVTIYDASSEGGTTYIAMEYLQGRELSRMLDSGHRFSFEDVASIGWKIADALDYAHRQEVVHRDIKPANIFIVRDRQPKIVDFGIARAPNRVADPAADADAAYTMFNRNNLLGTPNYMSPEQALGREVDHRTDLYSLGAVMYEMLTGKKPFQSTHTDQLLQLIAYKAPPAPHNLDPQIPPELSQIVMKAMSKRPEKRYQSGEEIVLELKRYLTRQRRARERNPLKSAAAAAAAAATVSTAPLAQSSGSDRRRFFIFTAAIGAGVMALAYSVWRHL
jgi:eukaryotic-like serine/threonine-protein kinase